jgi:hypothetical protein
MAYITVPLGYGRIAMIDADDFKRIMHDALYDNEEMRLDIPESCIDTFSYKAIALSGSATSAAVWSVMRTTWDSVGRETRHQFRENISWDGRALGWS